MRKLGGTAPQQLWSRLLSGFRSFGDLLGFSADFIQDLQHRDYVQPLSFIQPLDFFHGELDRASANVKLSD
jgi:hypothetical protein